MRSAWVRMSTALVVCLNSASIAVWMVLSLPDTRTNGESDLAMVVKGNFIRETRVTLVSKIRLRSYLPRCMVIRPGSLIIHLDGVVMISEIKICELRQSQRVPV